MEFWLWLLFSPFVLSDLSWGLIELLHVLLKNVVSFLHEVVNDHGAHKDESKSVEVLLENQVGKAGA